ncbi:MAG: hypothetical protein ACRC10_01795 [Thermoguttaceae bacterium]
MSSLTQGPRRNAESEHKEQEMGALGLDHYAASSENKGAYGFCPYCELPKGLPMPPELTELADSWPSLTNSQKEVILTIANANRQPVYS